MTKYTFKTIVASEAVRADFTALRDEFNSSDKELMQAVWNIGTKSRGALQFELKQVRFEMKEMKAAAKLKEKEVVVVKEEKAPKAKKAAKKVAKDKRVELVVVGEA